MPAINLLPPEIKPKGFVVGFAKTLKNIATLALVVFLVAAGVVVAAVVILSQRKNSSQTSQAKLEGEIRALESTEQRLILLKDRSNKIGDILTQVSAKEEADVLKEITRLFPEGMMLVDANLEKDVLEAKLSAPDLTTMSKFLTNVGSTQGLTSITLLSFEFSPDDGYSVELAFVK